MKLGRYAVYRGIEYNADLTSKVNGKSAIELRSGKEETVNIGFIKDKFGDFVKKVTIDELEQAYSVTTRGVYKGISYALILEEDSKVLIVEDDESRAKQFGFKFVERGVYEKWVDKNELERIWEEKEGIWGFKTPENAVTIIKV